MATAIDFAALFAEERAKMIDEMQGASAASDANPQQPAPAKGSPLTALNAWKSLPDPAVLLSSKPLLDLGERAVCSASLDGVHYVPDFVTSEEAAAMLTRLYEMPEESWAQLRRRRLQNHGGTPHSDGMMLEPIPRFVQAVSYPSPARSPFLPPNATFLAHLPFFSPSAEKMPAPQPCCIARGGQSDISIFAATHPTNPTVRGTLMLPTRPAPHTLHLLYFPSPAILKLTCWVCGAKPSTLERERARAHHVREPE